MRVFQSRVFEKKVKKLSKSNKLALDYAIHEIIQNPEIGVEKKGDLTKVFVYKYKVKTQQYLLAYRFTGINLELIKIDVHENFYRDLKKQIKH